MLNYGKRPRTEMPVNTPECPVCTNITSRLVRTGSLYSFRCCKECGAHYIDPVEPRVAPQVLFDRYPWTQQFSGHGLQFFKVNKTVTHVCVARPHFLDMTATPVSEGVKRI